MCCAARAALFYVAKNVFWPPISASKDGRRAAGARRQQRRRIAGARERNAKIG